MIVVSDATPIISFLKINRLDILNKLFGEVLLPEAVYEELTSNSAFQEEADEPLAETCLSIREEHIPSLYSCR